MGSNKLLKKAIALMGASTVLVSSATSCSFINIIGQAQNQKPYANVMMDVENFKVDDSIALKTNSGKYMRLKFEENRPVIIDCNKNIEEEEKRIISEVIDYYNEIFSTINEDCKFILKDENTDVLKTDTVIKIMNSKLSSSYHGIAYSFRTFDFGEGAFVESALIQLDWDKIIAVGQQYAFYVILHEMTHVLGLGDVYYKGDHITSNCINMTTIMQQGTINDGLFPNDYAILQALYSNEYTKHENYQDSVNIVNQKIKQYTKLFYHYYANFLKEKQDARGTLLVSDLKESIVWQGAEENNNHLCYELSVNGEDCELIIKNKVGEILEKAKGKIEQVNGIVFIKDVYISNASNYSSDYSNDVGIKLMLSVYKNADNQIIVRDMLLHAMETNIFLNNRASRV